MHSLVDGLLWVWASAVERMIILPHLFLSKGGESCLTRNSKRYRKIWSGQPLGENIGSIGPTPVQSGGPEILIGGYSPAAIQRVGRWGNGFIAGGRDPKGTQQFFQLAQESWKAEGRPGKPRLVGCFYYALGRDAKERAGAYLRNYYSFLGPMVEMMINSLPLTVEAIKERIQVYTGIGADEVIIWPCTTDLGQFDQLAELFR